jgi:hypothetical protein
LGGRDQENLSSILARGKISEDPISKIPFTKIGLLEWLKVKALSSIPRTVKKKKISTWRNDQNSFAL